MNDDQAASQMNAPFIAKIILGSLLVWLAYANVNVNRTCLIYGTITWFAYFAVAFGHDWARNRAIKACPDYRTACGSSRTWAFLLWPLFVIVTLFYVPLVWLLRRWLRWLPD